jgi:GDP-D-mannose 3',5'-epimerase
MPIKIPHKYRMLSNMKQKTAVILGGNGFIGHHLARSLRNDGYWVRTVDILEYNYGAIDFTDDYVIGDCRIKETVYSALLKGGKSVDEVYVMASWMGGAGVIFTGRHDDEILYNALSIDLNVAKISSELNVGKVFFSGSACCYNQKYQLDVDNNGLTEDMAYDANPDSDYGFGKLASERIYQAFHRNKGLNIRIGRFHNVCGIEGAWNNGKEKFPAACCRKVCEAHNGDDIEIWGDGLQTRSFISVSEAIVGVKKLMESDFTSPVNIGSEEIVSINDFTKMVIEISGKKLSIKNIKSDALGVRGRKSNNDLMFSVTGWRPSIKLKEHIPNLYNWVNKQVSNGNV